MPLPELNKQLKSIKFLPWSAMFRVQLLESFNGVHGDGREREQVSATLQDYPVLGKVAKVIRTNFGDEYRSYLAVEEASHAASLGEEPVIAIAEDDDLLEAFNFGSTLACVALRVLVKGQPARGFEHIAAIAQPEVLGHELSELSEEPLLRAAHAVNSTSTHTSDSPRVVTSLGQTYRALDLMSTSIGNIADGIYTNPQAKQAAHASAALLYTSLKVAIEVNELQTILGTNI